VTPVLVIGDVVTDILAVHTGAIAVGTDTAAAISVRGGGSAANTASWLAWLGDAVDLVAVVGRDPTGDQRVNELEAAGVGTRFIARTDAAPTGSVIVLTHSHERSFLCDRGANLHLGQSHVDKAITTGGARHLHLSGYALLDEQSRPAGLYALRAARAYGMTTSVDAASAGPLTRAADFTEWIRGVDLLFANLDEARVMAGAGEPGELATRLRTLAQNAVIKLGDQGAIWACPIPRLQQIPAHPTPAVIDPTGAGDAFAAGFLHAWLLRADPDVVLRRAAELGAAAVGSVGGRPPTPRRT
jgi:sugar/nucleoside kinase (ribokinase family)